LKERTSKHLLLTHPAARSKLEKKRYVPKPKQNKTITKEKANLQPQDMEYLNTKKSRIEMGDEMSLS